MKFDLSNAFQRAKAETRFKRLLSKRAHIELSEPKKTRSSQQNRALHLYFELICDELNELGLEFLYTGIKGVDMSTRYTPKIVKDFIWRPIQIAMFDIESTTQIDTIQIDEIIDVLTKFFGEKGIELEFPSFEALIDSNS